MQLTIKRIDDKLEIERISPKLNLQEIPEIFVERIETVDGIECESISFKAYLNEQFYNVRLRKKLNEYIFDIFPIKDPRTDEDTDQLIDRITTKYLVEDGFNDSEVNTFDSEKKMILSILLEIGKIESKLESLDKILERRIETTEEAFKNLENTLEDKYMEKKDISLLEILTNASKLDLVILFVILLTLVIAVDVINVKKYIREYIEDPANLVD